jgi:DNA-binding MarR family transcriptional regulator
VIAQVVDFQRLMLRAIHSATASAWLQLDLTMAQLKGLTILADRGPLTVTSLGQALGVGAPAASHLVERLVQLDLVTRQDDLSDRRRTIVALAPRGAEQVQQLRHDGVEHLRQWVSRLDPQDLVKLRDGLEALVSATRMVSCPSEGHGADAGVAVKDAALAASAQPEPKVPLMRHAESTVPG